MDMKSRNDRIFKEETRSILLRATINWVVLELHNPKSHLEICIFRIFVSSSKPIKVLCFGIFFFFGIFPTFLSSIIRWIANAISLLSIHEDDFSKNLNISSTSFSLCLTWTEEKTRDRLALQIFKIGKIQCKLTR